MGHHLKEKIAERIGAALERVLGPAASAADITLERPKVATHGDFACNVALQLARVQQRNPRDLAGEIVAALSADPAAREIIDRAEVAGPGFINLTVSATLRRSVVRVILAEKERFGTVAPHAGEKTMVEFVSANPTGPLHVGHARQAALGDTLAALLASQGVTVTREFYYNDAGAQIDKLTMSVQARLRGLKPNEPGWPEDAYNGDYLDDIASAFLAKAAVTAGDRSFVASGDPDDLDSIRGFAIAYLRHEQDLDLEAFGVAFDNFFLESSLYASGKVEAVVQRLVAAGRTYEKDGALFLRTTDAGDDKDRVVRRSTDGSYTYFVPDVAYHLDKWQRGFRKVVNVQGTDHQSAARRVQTALQWLDAGVPEGYPQYVLHKMVKVMRDGSEVKISKRAGSYVTLRDLVDWVGRDAARFFLASRKADTEFTFDVNLALSQSEDNPVYYVQYAHARIASVFAQWRERGGAPLALDEVDLSPLTSTRETALLQRLAAYPEMLEQAARDIAPHQIAFYLKECAAELHSYYNAERVLVDELEVRHARLALLAATQQVLRNGLALLGVAAPDKM